jgi:PleD family two-component response regulator
MTCNWGVAVSNPCFVPEAAGLIRAADEALYQAKNEGHTRGGLAMPERLMTYQAGRLIVSQEH